VSGELKVQVSVKVKVQVKGEDVILEGEVEGSVTSSIVGNRATSWPENPLQRELIWGITSWIQQS
ncbi:hypothetical protein Tco_0395928, partial [Tanacetum coccineum]